MSVATLGSRLRLLRESFEMTQDEVSTRSVDQDGRIVRRIEVGHVESGRNMASTRRIRAGLARAFGTTEDELFDYLEGRTTLAEFSKLRNRPRRSTPRDDARSDPRERAIELVVADGYGSAIEVRQAAARAREGVRPEKQPFLGILEWANLIETTLRQLRRSGDPASTSGINPRARAGPDLPARPKRRRSA